MKPKKYKFIIQIAQADVIVYGDSHAVAIAYGPGMCAPQIMAKGKKKRKEIILAVSRHSDIPDASNDSLASRLYHKCKTGEQIPEKLYAQVAEVLAAVMSGNKKQRILDFAAGNARPPLVKLKSLVLPQEVMRSLTLALNQQQHHVVMKKWGIKKAFPYGNGLILLFYGPPGVGKTATAEAIAGELGKKILVVDYSQMESKWLGETEKNIVAAFHRAKKEDCVLFWDEADCIMYNRDDAARSWEARPINVILQEVEKFSGVCIFSTNREAALDGALSRRINLKIEFKPPSRELVRELWTKMVPPDMPLAADVDFDMLSRTSLTGGDIKNIILNAARNAAGRGIDTEVTMADFKLALELETWSQNTTLRRIGFQSAERPA